MDQELTSSAATIAQLQAQVSELTQNFSTLLSKLGVQNGPPSPESDAPQEQGMGNQPPMS